MDALREWVMTLCACAAAVSIAESLLAEGAVKKTAYFVLSLVAASCLLSPVEGLRSFDLKIDESGAIMQNEDWLMKETNEEFAKNTAALIKDALGDIGVQPKKIIVMTDISDDGSVYINKARITLDRSFAERITDVENEISAKLGIEADINISE